MPDMRTSVGRRHSLTRATARGGLGQAHRWPRRGEGDAGSAQGHGRCPRGRPGELFEIEVSARA